MISHPSDQRNDEKTNVRSLKMELQHIVIHGQHLLLATQAHEGTDIYCLEEVMTFSV